jgi:hypothetical protein
VEVEISVGGLHALPKAEDAFALASLQLNYLLEEDLGEMYPLGCFQSVPPSVFL